MSVDSVLNLLVICGLECILISETSSAFPPSEVMGDLLYMVINSSDDVMERLLYIIINPTKTLCPKGIF